VDEIARGLDGDEFEVHYQPVVALADWHLLGVEALVRWNHPTRGILPPGSFMDLAERTGTILALGRAIFDKACGQTADWRRAGIDLEVAVNLSAKQLAHPGLLDDITATLATSGLDPHALWLEVTETALVEDVDQARAVLDRLAVLGIRIAIDDFGTGWASLTYLKQFPIHALKIDRTFVGGVDHDPQDAAIARSILSLGQELGLVVIAEGVETVAQQSALLALGCSVGQGFLYGKATPAAAVATQRANRI
jgi:EAL domain-containing protein (putative c-di-GMP-specific phosphodiesterase class I)